MVRYLLLISIGIFHACTPKVGEEEKNVLTQARTLQEEALALGEEVRSQLQELEQRRNSIEVQGRALTDAEIRFVDQVNQLLKRFDTWEKNHPPLPARLKEDPNVFLKKYQSHLDTVKVLRKEISDLLP